MNCLAYSLRFWNDNRHYNLFYNSNHVIAVEGTAVETNMGLQYFPIQDYGYDYFVSSFDGLLDEFELGLLREYFQV